MVDQSAHAFFGVVLRERPRSADWLRAHLDLSVSGDFLDQDGDFCPFIGNGYQVTWKSRDRLTDVEYKRLTPALKTAAHKLEYQHELSLKKELVA